MDKKLNSLKNTFKNWGEAKKTNTKLLSLSVGYCELARRITNDNMTPHTQKTKVVFGGEHFHLANMAGAMGVYSYLVETEEPLLAGGEPPEFCEPSVLEEKYLIAKARVVEHQKNDDKGRIRKSFNAFIEVMNPEGSLKAIFELRYIAKPIVLREKEIAQLRERAIAFNKSAH